MKVKRTISLLLILSFLGFYPAHLSWAQDNNKTLYQFLAENKEYKANFEYPSYIAAVNASGKILLPSHTPVVISNNSEINTKTIRRGDNIEFVVVQDVVDSRGNILIKANSPVNANITFEEKTYIGQSAKITISDFHVKGVDGTYIPLSTVITEEPDDRMVLSIVLSVFCILFLLMKGKDAKVPAGTVKTVYTITDTYIKPQTI